MNLGKAFNSFPQIETKRLVLRRIVADDAANLLEIFRDPVIARAHGNQPYTHLDQALRLIHLHDEAYDGRTRIRWAVTKRGENQLIGSLGFHHLVEAHFRCEIGYELARPYWRQGIMTEAVTAVVRFGFEVMGFHRIEAIVAPGNNASANLLRKVGFREEGFLLERFFEDGRFIDDWFFAILKSDFDKKWQGMA